MKTFSVVYLLLDVLSEKKQKKKEVNCTMDTHACDQLLGLLCSVAPSRFFSYHRPNNEDVRNSCQAKNGKIDDNFSFTCGQL